MWLLAVVGGEIGQSWALAVGRYYLRKDQGLIVLTALCLGNALNSILKTFWHEPRPFFVSDLIIPARCSNFEYGLPSGHTMGTLLVWRTLLKLFDGGFKTQSTIYTCIFFISYNRAQQ
jgi:membrane-associated phospholipid phosphatase